MQLMEATWVFSNGPGPTAAIGMRKNVTEQQPIQCATTSFSGWRQPQ